MVDSDFRREESLGWLVAAVSASMGRDLNAALGKKGLDLKLWPTLMCLWEREGITQTELSRMAQVAGYTTTRILDRLEAMNLVERRADPKSRRSHRLYLTGQGRRLQRTLTAEAQKINRAHLAPLDGRERQTLVRLMRKIMRNSDA